MELVPVAFLLLVFHLPLLLILPSSFRSRILVTE